MNTIPDHAESDIETRLRAEFGNRAAHATGADRILTALATQPVALRSRRAPAIGRWAAVAAGVAIVAAGIPIGLHLAHPAPSIGTATTPAPAHQSTGPHGDLVYHLTYQPTWLPPGYVTDGRRSTASGDSQFTQWTHSAPTGQSIPLIQVGLEGVSTAGGQGGIAEITAANHPVTVNGHPAALRVTSAQAADITWQPDPENVVTASVDFQPDAAATVQQIARSLVPDSIPVTSGLVPNSLPAGYQMYWQEVDGTQNAPIRSLEASDGPPKPENADLAIVLNPTTEPVPPTGSVDGAPAQVTVRGRTGYFAASDDEALLAVQLADGSWLSADSHPMRTPGSPTAPVLTQAQLVTILNAVTIDPHPELSGFGS